MKQYLDLLNRVLTEGVHKEDRTGTGTISVFGHQMRFNMEDGFPCLTTKKLHLKSIIYELLWFLNGDTNAKYLQDHGVRIWNEWADENGDLGHIYGYQWRSWPDYKGGSIDQISEAVETILHNPDSRRIIVSAWNVGDINNMNLPPCHAFFQFYVANGRLSLQLYQRRADIFLGVPFNIASYALLTMMVAQVCGLRPGDFVHTLGDTHIYNNHFWQHCFRQMLQIGLMFADRNETAREMLEYCYEVWTARAPASGFNRDGEWHNGTGYFTANTHTLYYVPSLFSYLTGPDFLKHPWYQNAGSSLVYTCPQGSKSNGFGDSSEKGSEPNRLVAAFADYLACETGNSYAGWYAGECRDLFSRDYELRLNRMCTDQD